MNSHPLILCGSAFEALGTWGGEEGGGSGGGVLWTCSWGEPVGPPSQTPAPTWAEMAFVWLGQVDEGGGDQERGGDGDSVVRHVCWFHPSKITGASKYTHTLYGNELTTLEVMDCPRDCGSGRLQVRQYDISSCQKVNGGTYRLCVHVHVYM